MSKISRFEDILAWQKARELSKIVFKLTKSVPFSKDFTLCDQIKRSSGSAMDNIAEGFERGGNREFVHFLSISKASASEVRSQLFRALDNEYISQDEFDSTFQLAEEVGKLISGFMKYLKNSQLKGEKFNYKDVQH